MLKVDEEGIPGMRWSLYAIHGYFFFKLILICPEQFVPNNKNLRIIFVEVYRINSVMDSMMTGRYNNLFQKTHGANMLRMVPELSKEVNRCDQSKNLSWDANKGQGQVKDRNKGEYLTNGLPQGTGKIKLLTAVVYKVSIPQKINLMFPSMHPISRKIFGNKYDHKHPPCGLQGLRRSEMTQ